MKINNSVDNCNYFRYSGRSEDTCVYSTIPIIFFSEPLGGKTPGPLCVGYATGLGYRVVKKL